MLTPKMNLVLPIQTTARRERERERKLYELYVLFLYSDTVQNIFGTLSKLLG